MKKRYLAAVLLLFVAAIAAAVAAFAYRHKQALTVPSIDEVVSADFSEGRPFMPTDPVPQHLIAAQADDRAVLAKVLAWVQSARVVGKGSEPMPTIGVHTFALHLTQNREFGLAFAGYRNSDVLLYTSEGNSSPLHLDSPPLKQWLRDGWREELKLGPYGQQAVDAVFTFIDAAAMPGLPDFPRSVGSRAGTINIGGPAPGSSIPATFETAVADAGGGKFQVQLTRRWGSGVAFTTWTFAVDGNGAIRDQGRTGDDPPQIP